MKLIEHFDALIKAGVVLHFKIAAAGDNVQLDIIPVGKDSKTGVSLPPQALVGSAAEIDDGLDEFLPKYAGTVARIADVVAKADTELAAVEAAASAQAKRAVEEKSKTKPKPGAKVHSSAKQDPAKGMLETGDAAGDEDEVADSGTELNTTGGATPPEDGAGETNALNPGLF